MEATTKGFGALVGAIGDGAAAHVVVDPSGRGGGRGGRALSPPPALLTDIAAAFFLTKDGSAVM